MRIDKSRSDNPTSGIDHLDVPARQWLNFRASADCGNPTAPIRFEANQHRSIRNYRQLPHLPANAGPHRPGQRDQLRAVQQQKLFGSLSHRRLKSRVRSSRA
jgi:hypothetical protein